MKIETAATLEALEPQALSMYVFREKYAAPGEQTHLDVQRRVAKALGRDSAQEGRFLSTLVSGFIPGGRINASAGLERKTTLVNCFVQPLADCMTGELRGVPGIMDAIGEAAETMRQGGGVGYDFSPLRPSRARVKGTDSEASGPVSSTACAIRWNRPEAAVALRWEFCASTTLTSRPSSTQRRARTSLPWACRRRWQNS